MDRAGKWTEWWSLSRPALAIFGMIIVLILLSAVTIWRTAIEANRIDSERTALAIRNAIAGESAQLLAIAADNAQWDEAATAFYDGGDRGRFFATNFVDTSADGLLYDGVVAVREDGTALLSIRRGENASVDPQRWIGTGLARLLALASSDGTAHGLLSGADGPRLVAIARVVPTSDTRVAAFAANQTEPVYLLFTRQLDQSALATIGQDLVLAEVRLGDTQGAGALPMEQIGERDVISLQDIRGITIASLSWLPSRPGHVAIARSTPFILLSLLAGLLASILMLRQGYASVSEMNRIGLLDSLSDLPNRRALRRLTRHVLRGNREVALAFVDLDGFKSVNDLYGHSVGDELIIRCASIITELAPSPGGCARLGGDEFALLAYGPDAKRRITNAAEALLARMREPFQIGDRTITIGASIGLSDRTTANDSASELMREADVAMYVAKRAGKMRWVWFDPAHERDRTAALEVEQRLRAALETGDFKVVYQPMIDAQRGFVSGFEALLRWRSADGTPLDPEHFIPIAEDTGLIDRIGEFVLQRACRDAKSWGGHHLSVNVSASQLRNPNFVSRLAEILVETDFPAGRLILEITETYVVSDPNSARCVIDAVRALGVRVALDDFGTGYASIGFLRQFAFDSLKIDRTLVAEAMNDHAARIMLQSTIALARALDMTTVAEGIENEAQAVIMRAAGCDLLQGWHFARETDADTSAAMFEPSRTLFIQRA